MMRTQHVYTGRRESYADDRWKTSVSLSFHDLMAEIFASSWRMAGNFTIICEPSLINCSNSDTWTPWLRRYDVYTQLSFYRPATRKKVKSCCSFKHKKQSFNGHLPDVPESATVPPKISKKIYKPGFRHLVNTHKNQGVKTCWKNSKQTCTKLNSISVCHTSNN